MMNLMVRMVWIVVHVIGRGQRGHVMNDARRRWERAARMRHAGGAGGRRRPLRHLRRRGDGWRAQGRGRRTAHARRTPGEDNGRGRLDGL